jgi:hypothetical protein
MPKLAISALLNRVMNPGRFHQIWLWVLTALVFVSSSPYIVVLFTMCDLPEAMWKPQLVAAGAGTCRPNGIQVAYAIFTGGKSRPSWEYGTIRSLRRMSSNVRFRRSIPCHISHGCAGTTSDHIEEVGIVRGDWELCGCSRGCRTGSILTYIGRARWRLSSVFNCQVYIIRQTRHGSKDLPRLMSPLLT